MVVGVFGKNGCEVCKQTERKVTHFLNKWGISDSVRLSFFDMDTVDGMAEGMFYDVDQIPATIIFDDSGGIVWRCDGERPLSREMQQHLVRG